MNRCDSGANGTVRMGRSHTLRPEFVRGFFMDLYLGYAAIFAIIVLFFLFLRLYAVFFPKTSFNYSRFAARVGIFGAIATILYIVPVFQVNLPFFPPFMALHFDEIPIFIAGFAYGPFTAFAITIVKSIIKLPMTSTMGVGELADFVYTLAFVLPSAIIYKRWRNLKGVFLGFGVSLFAQLFVSSLMNAYVMLPFYMFVMGFSYESLLAMCQAANPAITSLEWPFVLFAVLPLNLLKDALVLFATFFVYKGIHKILKAQKA